MKKKSIIIFTVLGLIILILGIILLIKNNVIKEKSKLQIIDATFSCTQTREKFYENDEHIYYFPCAAQSTTVYVKFENGNKMLVVDALQSKETTIEKLIDAGLEVYIENK